MPIDPGAVGAVAGPVERSWTSDDCLLYALGVGAGVDEPAFTTENTDGVPQQVLPTFPVLLGAGGVYSRIGTFDPALLLHGSQGVTLHGALPVEGTVLVTTTVTGIWDKGTAAVVEARTDGVDVGTGEPRFTTRSAAFVWGEGGGGGDRGPSAARLDADAAGPPDHEVTYTTSRDQALVYRLSGDRNPLHSDPAFAARAGLPRPILHGLCTYGFAGRALLHTLCGSDPARFGSVDARFAAPVFPGEGLTVQMWADGDEAAFRVVVPGDGRVVVDGGRFVRTPA